MAYKRLCDGSRVFDTAKNLDVHHGDWNELQDQLISDFEERQVLTFPQGFVSDRDPLVGGFGFQDWYRLNYQIQNDTTNDVVWVAKFDLTAGEQITEIEAVIAGSAGLTGGEVVFKEISAGGTVNTTITLAAAGANPWDTGGAAFGSADTYTETVAHASLPMAVVADRNYLLYFKAATNAAGGTSRIWWYHLKVQRD